jgi:integrase
MAEIPRGSVWVVDFRDAQGKRRVIRAGENKTVALAMLNAKLKQMALDGLSGTQGIEAKTLEEVSVEYMKMARVNKRSWLRDEQLLRDLKEYFGANKVFSQISVAEVEDYRVDRREGWSPATCNRAVALFKHVFNFAIDRNWAKENPVRRIKLYRENNERVRFLEPQEKERLLAFCGAQLRPLVVTALFTGMRIGELLALTWADVDLGRKLIHVRDSKSGKGRHIPMSASVYEVLSPVTRHIDNARVFYNEDGKPYRSCRSAFATALRRAGIRDFRWHDLRHSFASYLAMAGVDLNMIRELMGHKTITMTLRYSHLAPQFKTQALDKLEAFCDTQETQLTKKTATG